MNIEPLQPHQADPWIDAQLATRGDHELPRLSHLYHRHQDGVRRVLAAWEGDVFLGHVSVLWDSEYDVFRRMSVAEIVDLWVQPDARRHGVARALLRAAEDTVRAKGYTRIGLGVGVTRDFGPAHRLYATSGYYPDGSGVWAQGKMVERGDIITCDDETLWMWVKQI